MPLGSAESVLCGWDEIHVWSANGSFVIGSKNDKKTYASLPYLRVENVHILEQVIRVGFKRGVSRLSDLL